MGTAARSRLLMVVCLAVALSVAGCFGPVVQNAPSSSPIDARDAPHGSEGRLAGFVAFTLLDAGLQTLYPDIYEDLLARSLAQLPAERTWSLGLFLEESFITDVENPQGLVRDHGAVIALPDFGEPRDRIHYVGVEGQIFDLLQYVNEEREDFRSVPLIVGDTFQLLQPETLDLATLYQDFDAVTAGNIATHVGAQGFAFGTTLQHIEEAAAEASGETPQGHPFDVGLYDLFDARYLPASTKVEAFHIPVVTLQRTKGQELLGDRVHVEGFLISEAQLIKQARERVPELRDLAEAWGDVKTASRTFVDQGTSDLDTPTLSRLAEDSQAQAANQHRIPGYFLAYNIAPEDPRGFFALQDLAEGPFPEEELLAHIVTEGYATGTTAETVCTAATEGACEFRYDVGLYHLLNFTIGNDYLPTFYQVPVVFPGKTIPPALLAAALTPVRFEGVWVQKSLLRDDVHVAVARNADNAAFAEVFLNDAAASRPWADLLKTVDGFLYAFEMAVVIPLHDAPAPVLLHKEGEGDNAMVHWTPTIAGDFDRYEVHQSTNSRFQPSESTLVRTISSVDQTSHVPADLEARGRYFKIWVFNERNMFTSSNGVRVGDLTAEEFGGHGDPTVTVEGVTRCADEPDSCLRVSWTADPTDAFEKFEVYRRTSTSDWTLVDAILDSSEHTFRDEGLACGTEYWYHVKLYAGDDVASSDGLSETPRRASGYCY